MARTSHGGARVHVQVDGRQVIKQLRQELVAFLIACSC
jgi:hypothetical protein